MTWRDELDRWAHANPLGDRPPAGAEMMLDRRPVTIVGPGERHGCPTPEVCRAASPGRRGCVAYTYDDDPEARVSFETNWGAFYRRGVYE